MNIKITNAERELLLVALEHYYEISGIYAHYLITMLEDDFPAFRNAHELRKADENFVISSALINYPRKKIRALRLLRKIYPV